MHYTPLLAAIRYIQPQSVRILLSRGADMMVKDTWREYNAILWAVEVQSTKILKVWIQLSIYIFNTHVSSKLEGYT